MTRLEADNSSNGGAASTMLLRVVMEELEEWQRVKNRSRLRRMTGEKVIGLVVGKMLARLLTIESTNVWLYADDLKIIDSKIKTLLSTLIGKEWPILSYNPPPSM